MVWSYFHHYHLRSSSLRVVKTEADIVSSVQNAISSKSRIRAMGSLYVNRKDFDACIKTNHLMS
ncbi:UNVERIFIED_CONTAM: hypothetical protein HDU68_006031, partial [Siphonaria sp. JEL0065]